MGRNNGSAIIEIIGMRNAGAGLTQAQKAQKEAFEN